MRFRLRTLLGQFTLRGMFHATFWSALWCWALIVDFKWQGSEGLMICAIAYRFAGPFIALGALFGRTLVGAAVGFAVVLVLAAGAYVSIMNSSTFS